VATVVAALISGMIALVSLTLSKEQKISEFRQAWIDGLRNDLGFFLSSLRVLARVANVRVIYGPEIAQFKFPHTPEHMSQLRVSASEALFHIMLRLNPEENTHGELLRLLRVAQASCDAIDPAHPNAVETLNALEAAAEYARPVLKTEWNRVKAGEPAFRRLRFWLLPVIIVLSVGLAAFIAFARFHY